MNNNTKQSSSPQISIIMPCLNEASSINHCLKTIRKTAQKSKSSIEVILVDNGSTDNSLKIAHEAQEKMPELIILEEKVQGYGSAYMRGLREARGEYIFMADTDGSYDFGEFPRFVEELKKGYDLVVGNRFGDRMGKKSMPWLHKYIGNPFLSYLVKLFFKVKINDIHCGLRAIKNESAKALALYTTGMEFASEMIIKSAKKGQKITELPTSYRQRIGDSKLRSYRDGWRHIRFIFLYSPLALFLAPGLTLFLLGIISTTAFYITNIKIFDIQFYFHPMFFSAMLIVLGYQLIFFAMFAKIYAINHFGEDDRLVKYLFKHVTIEKAGVLAILVISLALALYGHIFWTWTNGSYESIQLTKNSILALTLFAVGAQTFFSAFMFSILGIKEK